MPIYTARVIRTIIDEHGATLTVEAETVAQACTMFEEIDLEEFQAQKDYRSSDNDIHRYKNCQIDGVPTGDDWVED